MKKTITGILVILFLVFAIKLMINETKPSEVANYNVKIVDDGFNTASLVNVILSIMTLGISIIALRQIKLAKKAIKQDIDSRNLGYLSDLDRFLIEKPELWQFYNAYDDIAKKHPIKTYDANTEQLRGFIYFKLNHFEITFKDDNVSDDIKKSWMRYMIYCMKHSDCFTREIENILLDDGYKGLFGKRFMIKLSEIYKEAFDPNSDYNKYLKTSSEGLEDIRNVINYTKTPSRVTTNEIPITQIDELIVFYNNCKETLEKIT